MNTCAQTTLTAPTKTLLPAYLLPAVTLFLIFAAQRSFAPPPDGANCRGCHTTVRNEMYLRGEPVEHESRRRLLKVYQVVQGQTAAIGLQLTNRYGGNHGLFLVNLNAPGQANSANRLAYTGDATWANRTDGALNYFSVGPSGGTFPLARTHNLVIKSNTPVDLYKVQFQMAGLANGEWSEMENFTCKCCPLRYPRLPHPSSPRHLGALDNSP